MLLPHTDKTLITKELPNVQGGKLSLGYNALILLNRSLIGVVSNVKQNGIVASIEICSIS